jgi:hypothetical protein
MGQNMGQAESAAQNLHRNKQRKDCFLKKENSYIFLTGSTKNGILFRN